jgi:uncharacterized protein (TIGR00369 family)
MQIMQDNPDRALLESLISAGNTDADLEIIKGLDGFDMRFIFGSPGSLEFSFVASKKSLQGNAVVAGGILMTMLDYAMAFAVLSKLPFGKTCLTTSINVNMLSAATPNTYKVLGNIDRIGRQVAFARSEIRDIEHGKVIANASATFFITNYSSRD